MAEILIDATLIIDAINNHSRAVRFVDELVLAREAITHAQVAAEVFTVTRNAKELADLLRFLRRFTLVHTNETDSPEALKYLERFHLSHNLGFSDCLIATTALRLNLPVATLNVRDFRLFKGLKVIRSY